MGMYEMKYPGLIFRVIETVAEGRNGLAGIGYEIQSKGLLWGWNYVCICHTKDEATRWLDEFYTCLKVDRAKRVVEERDFNNE